MVRGAGKDHCCATASRFERIENARFAHLRLTAHGPDLPERNVENISADKNGGRNFLCRQRSRCRSSRSERAHRRIRPKDLSLQSMRLDRDATVPLAMQLLPEPLPWPDPGLDA